MPSQIGYFDSLKSAAGKVFSYLASISLTGTDGKTITCTQDTSLDEAVAMSSKAPKSAPVFICPVSGDGFVFDRFSKASTTMCLVNNDDCAHFLSGAFLHTYEEITGVIPITPASMAWAAILLNVSGLVSHS